MTEIKMKWQNLKDGNCPACGAKLFLDDRHYKIYECTAGLKCPKNFHIREDKLLNIIRNPQSLANQYHRGAQDEAQGFERHQL